MKVEEKLETVITIVSHRKYLFFETLRYSALTAMILKLTFEFGEREVWV